jgi:hypothetical protein
MSKKKKEDPPQASGPAVGMLVFTGVIAMGVIFYVVKIMGIMERGMP